MRDGIVLGGAVFFFALLVTVHLAAIAGLLARPPRWQGALAIVVPPFTPFFAHRAGLRVRAALWVVSATAYAVFLGLARH